MPGVQEQESLNASLDKDGQVKWPVARRCFSRSRGGGYHDRGAGRGDGSLGAGRAGHPDGTIDYSSGHRLRSYARYKSYDPWL